MTVDDRAKDAVLDAAKAALHERYPMYPIRDEDALHVVAAIREALGDPDVDAAEDGDQISSRGLRYTQPVPGKYGGSVRVYESSAADAPHVWVNAIDPDGADACVHLTLENAAKFATNIQRVCRLHYQNR